LIAALVERRKALGITQNALADVLGIHKQFVSRYELGERRLDAVEYADVARALGIEAGKLLDEATRVSP
jgi:transcriptional regulator with XRE-family HTH domain